jgi:hypothetical protein
MAGELPKIRTQLKRKLPKLIGEQDTLSIIWFSGKKQYGLLLENESIPTLGDLKSVENAIDRWLKPVGLTGFKEPLEESIKLISKLSSARPGAVNNLFFMSDGQDNQWSSKDILDVTDALGGLVASSTFVEYGYYADRKLLSSMAEKSGGSLIFAEDFDKFTPILEGSLSKKLKGGKKVEVHIKGDPIGAFLFAIDGSDIVTFALKEGKALVPEYIKEIFYLNPSAVGKKCESSKFYSGLYGALSLFSVRMKTDIILSILKLLGDIRFIDKFAGLFGKQAYSDFMEESKIAAFDEKKRFINGKDFNRIPRSDSFTVMEFLSLLAKDAENRVLLDHESFKYNKIGRAKIDATSVLSEDEQEEISALTDEISKTKDPKKVSELSAKIASISNKPEALKFVAEPNAGGYSVSNLTFNEDRPNVSILIRKTGHVDISSRNPPEGIPTSFETFIYRNYTIIKDGLVNISVLPVLLSPNTLAEIQSAIREGRCKPEAIEILQDHILVHLSKIPVINRNMIQNVSAKDFFGKCYDLTKSQAISKVANAILKEQFVKKSDGFITKYGDLNTQWLKDNGFTEFSGFSPKSVQAESTDFYMGKELKVSLKGLSSLPSLKVARENIAKKKINAPTALMQKTIEELDAFSSTDPSAESLEKWLLEKANEATEKSRNLIREIAATTFTIIVGQVWFTEFSSIEENAMIITFDGSDIECKAELREIEIKI